MDFDRYTNIKKNHDFRKATAMNRWIITAAICALFGNACSAVNPAEYEGARIATDYGAQPLEPLFDTPLKDIQVLVTPDGWYYMTATLGYPDWQIKNDGIYLWKSKNLKTWKSISKVWDIEKDGTWQKDFQTVPDSPLSQKGRAVWAPEIHHIKDNYYIVFAMNYGGIGILKSKTGEAEGPYVDPVGKELTSGIDGFFFQDDDKTVYFIWGGGNIARMKTDMTGFAEKPRHIVNVDGENMGYEGCSLIKHKGKYVLFASDWHGSHEGTYDLMYSVSDNIYGPYSKRKFGIPHAGHATVFKGLDGKLYSTAFGSDGTAPYHMRLGYVEIGITDNWEIKVKE